MISDEQLTVEIAKLCGWTIEDGCRLTDPAGNYIGELGCAFDEFTDVLPDYPHDLNAINRAYRKLIGDDPELVVAYYKALVLLLNNETANQNGCLLDSCSALEIGAWSVNASARARSIALLDVMDPQAKLTFNPYRPTKEQQIAEIMGQNEDNKLAPYPLVYEPI
ncbi:MAG: hypothetical protein EBU46_06060 [Nitrosomonadaceae bacterium]|nr:hypothetical protein [Nitrosomonadaceae bacterium]